jgi:hypothetical protein
MSARGSIGTVDNSRAIEAVLQRLQGPSAVGQLLVHSVGTTGEVPWGSCAIPTIKGSALDAATVFVRPNPATLDANGNGGNWPVNAAGVLVDVESLQGGIRPNLPAGTRYRWDDGIDGVEETSASAGAGLTGGSFGETEPAFGGILRFVGQYKQLNKVDATQLFAAQAFDFPAAVLTWESTQPSDGPMQSSPGPRTTRVGSTRMIYRHIWTLFLITSRTDTEGERRREGERLRDQALEVLSDCVSARGLWVSMSPGIEMLEARVAAVTPTSYVDVLRFATHIVVRHRPAPAVYNPWEHTRIQVQHAASPPAPAINLGDVTVTMNPPPPVTP